MYLIAQLPSNMRHDDRRRLSHYARETYPSAAVSAYYRGTDLRWFLEINPSNLPDPAFERAIGDWIRRWEAADVRCSS